MSTTSLGKIPESTCFKLLAINDDEFILIPDRMNRPFFKYSASRDQWTRYVCSPFPVDEGSYSIYGAVFDEKTQLIYAASYKCVHTVDVRNMKTDTFSSNSLSRSDWDNPALVMIANALYTISCNTFSTKFKFKVMDKTSRAATTCFGPSITAETQTRVSSSARDPDIFHHYYNDAHKHLYSLLYSPRFVSFTILKLPVFTNKTV